MSKRKRPGKRAPKRSKEHNAIGARIPRPETNIRASIVVVPHFASEDARSKVPAGPQGHPGSYIATFILSVPGKDVFHESVNTEQLMRSGTSLLEVPSQLKEVIIEASADNHTYIVAFARNAQGLLSSAKVRIDAPNFREAERLAFNIVNPLLSLWSFQYNIAIDVSICQIQEERTATRMWSLALLGRPKLFSIDTSTHAVAKRFRPVLATYREAMNATNLFHSVLCYYKAIRATQLLTQTRFEHSASRQIEKPPPDRFPDRIEAILLDTKDHTALFQPFLGKKFNWVMDQYQVLLRNAYAHLDPERDDLSADDFDDNHQCIRAIPILRYIARQLLQAEMAAQSTQESPTPSAASIPACPAPISQPIPAEESYSAVDVSPARPKMPPIDI